MKTNKENKSEVVVIDATNGVVGRIASFAAKQALLGKDVNIVNCNKAILTGNQRSVIQEYYLTRKRGGSSLNGPFYPKQPQKMMKRTVRGMLNYQQGRGLTAFKKIMCYDALPKEFMDAKKISFAKELRTTSITLEAVGKEI